MENLCRRILSFDIFSATHTSEMLISSFFHPGQLTSALLVFAPKSRMSWMNLERLKTISNTLSLLDSHVRHKRLSIEGPAFKGVEVFLPDLSQEPQRTVRNINERVSLREVVHFSHRQSLFFFYKQMIHNVLTIDIVELFIILFSVKFIALSLRLVFFWETCLQMFIFVHLTTFFYCGICSFLSLSCSISVGNLHQQLSGSATANKWLWFASHRQHMSAVHPKNTLVLSQNYIVINKILMTK